MSQLRIMYGFAEFEDLLVVLQQSLGRAGIRFGLSRHADVFASQFGNGLCLAVMRASLPTHPSKAEVPSKKTTKETSALR
ncbi:hypothetical protein AR457_38695 [Streptomyces agglomeratus]|nr:hypothetical protein AR457_38695 [Streptomyces agglomeratus]